MSTGGTINSDENRLKEAVASTLKETKENMEIVYPDARNDTNKNLSEESGITSPKSEEDIEFSEVIEPRSYFGAALTERSTTNTKSVGELLTEQTRQGPEAEKHILVIESRNNESANEKDNINAERNEATGIKVINAFSSLSSLALEYASSDSEEEEEEERAPSPCETIPIVQDRGNIAQNKTEYRSKSTNDDSASEDTDSDSDDSSSDDSTSSESDSISELEDSIEVGKSRTTKVKKNKSEFDDLPPIEELKITVPEELCDRLGEVSAIVEQLVLVRPISGKPTLNLDSILFLEKGRRVLGQVFDVFGQVSEPNYCIRFNSEEHIKQSEIVVGMEVYYSPNTEHTSLVFLHELVKLKGVDVSGDDDIEPPEFSDDDEERAYNQMQRQKQRQKPGGNAIQENSDVEKIPHKRQCHEWARNPWSSNWRSQSYNSPRPRWNPENSQPPFQNSYNLQNAGHPSNPPFVDQYGQTITPPQYQFNPYGNPYHYNHGFPPQNPGYAFGRPPAFRHNFNSYDPNFQRSNQYQQPPMSWTPPPPPPPPPSL